MIIKFVDAESNEAMTEYVIPIVHTREFHTIQLDVGPYESAVLMVVSVQKDIRYHQFVVINEISLTETSCSTLDCTDLFSCGNMYCIPESKVCDLVNDCPNGEDEICAISVNCFFDTRQVCGYNLALQTAWYDDGLGGGESYIQFRYESNHSYIYYLMFAESPRLEHSDTARCLKVDIKR